MVTIAIFLFILVAGIYLVKERSSKPSTVIGVLLAFLGAFGLFALLI